MAEAILLPIAKSILVKLASFTGDLASTYVASEIIGAVSAKKDLKLIAEKLTAISAILQDAEEKQYSNKAIKVWLRDLKITVYDIDDLLDDVCFDALRYCGNKGHLRARLRYYLSTSNPLISSFDWSHKIRALRVNLVKIVAKKNDFGLTEYPLEIPTIKRDPFDECAYVNRANIIGRDDAKYDIIRKLLAQGDASNLNVLPIVGMGGIGKTTLAKLVYRDVDHFDIKLWACVSEKFNIRKILEDLIGDATGENTSNRNLGRLVETLQDLLNGKRYLLVLDDVWVDDIIAWRELRSMLEIGNLGSVILITTRNANVASTTQTMEPHNLDRLPDSVCWSIFSQLAFMEGEEQRQPNLDSIGRSIVRRCHGIPLVIRSLGSLLRNERDEHEWQRIDNMGGITRLFGQDDKVLQFLKLSYDKLPSSLKPCFAYCSLMAKDSTLFPKKLIYIWSALGLLQPEEEKEIESCGYTSFMELLSRSMLQEPKSFFDESIRKCSMHDFLHDLAVHVLGDELAIVTCNELKVSELSRHIVWGYEGSRDLSKMEFPIELLKAKNARTFRFSYQVNYISQSFLEGIISSFSCLRILDLEDSWFEELPRSVGSLKHLRVLHLSWNPIIKSLPNTVCRLFNLQSFRLDGCENLKELPRKIHRLISLRHFCLTTCQRTLAATKFKRLHSLRHLWICYCKELVSLWDDHDVGRLSSLRYLCIQDCPRLISLPNSMKLLVTLTTFVIRNCQNLDLEKGEGLEGLQSLRSLSILRVPRLASLPHGIQSAAATLRYLCIENCGNLIELPSWLRRFALLRKFGIRYCSNLVGLPQGFQHLNSLQELIIQDCPHLSQRCTVPCGEDYHLIRHVPKIYLDGHLINGEANLTSRVFEPMSV